MYHVLGTGFIAVFLYLISYLFYKTGFYSVLLHKKVWNTILAIAFIMTAMAGVFMALQINYKWDIPIIKTVLKWHVEFGIAMAITGLFHLIWHLSYFKKIFTGSEPGSEPTEPQKIIVYDISLNLFLVGFVSTSFQLLLLREMMNISGGYELIAGTFLGSWLIASAIGSYLAPGSPLSDLRKINLIFAVSPLFSLFLLLFLSRLFFITGETPSFLFSLIYTFLVLIPFCLISGFTFMKLLFIARSGNKFSPGRSFSIETAGGIVAGILISVMTAGILNTYQLILLIILAALSYLILVFFMKSKREKVIARFSILAIASCIIIFNPDIFFRQILLPGINITNTTDTPYGNISEGKYNGEQSLYYNHRLRSYNDDVTEREEDIHYAMLQRNSHEKVILISGSLASHLNELIKYSVSKIIYIERDPALARSGLSDISDFSGELVIQSHDAFSYIRSSKEKVDAILQLIPPPSTLLLNRYYTTDFFNEIKKNLNQGGIFMCSPGPGDTYFNQESLNLYSSIYNSLAAVFKNVMPIIGNKLYFLASDEELSLSICHLTEERNIINTWVNHNYLSDDIIKTRSDEFRTLINPGIRENRYASPIASSYFQSYILSKNMNEKIVAMALMILLFAMPAMIIKRRNLLMYSSASALAGFEIIILLTLQLIVGNMYHLTGLIIAGLMAGLAIGAVADNKFLNTIHFKIKAVSLIIFYAGIGLLYTNILKLNNEAFAIIILMLLAFLPAFLTGHLFNELTRSAHSSAVPASTYSADLAGSAFGFIFISGFAVPVLGIEISIFVLSALIFAGLAFGIIRNK